MNTEITADRLNTPEPEPEIARQIDILLGAQEIIMKARVVTMRLQPVHDKLCRVATYLNAQAAELLKEAEADHA